MPETIMISTESWLARLRKMRTSHETYKEYSRNFVLFHVPTPRLDKTRSQFCTGHFRICPLPWVKAKHCKYRPLRCGVSSTRQIVSAPLTYTKECSSIFQTFAAGPGFNGIVNDYDFIFTHIQTTKIVSNLLFKIYNRKIYDSVVDYSVIYAKFGSLCMSEMK